MGNLNNFMKLKSVITDLKISEKILFDKLCEIKNFKKIMPQNISKFEILDANTLIFSLKGMPAIKLVFGQKNAHSLITLVSSESKISFYLKAEIKISRIIPSWI